MPIIQIYQKVLQCYRGETVLSNGTITNFTSIDATDSFDFKNKITGQTSNDDTKDVEIMASLEYLSNFWRILEMS